MLLLEKAILEFFQFFYLKFNLVHYLRKKLHVNANNLLRLYRNFSLK